MNKLAVAHAVSPRSTWSGVSSNWRQIRYIGSQAGNGDGLAALERLSQHQLNAKPISRIKSAPRRHPRRPFEDPSAKKQPFRPGWAKNGVPRLRAFDADKATPHKLVKKYSSKLEHVSPMLIKNLPGFLSSQRLIDSEGSFQRPRNENLGFDVLKTIWASAISGVRSSEWTTDRDPAVFDQLEAVMKIKSTAFEGEEPPILRFLRWVRQSRHLNYSLLEAKVSELLEAHAAESLSWTVFTAPLVFVRAVHQYNLTQQTPPGELAPSKDAYYFENDQSTCITGLSALVVLEEDMTEEFPFPRIIRDIGQSTYNTRSCSIRVGVRPLRVDMRRSRESTIVVGQISGNSIVTLVPPKLNALKGAPLQFHERVPQTDLTTLTPKIWTREFEDKLMETRDVLTAQLNPGHGLLVPPGWWYGVRSIVNGLHLHSTVTWFLGRDDGDLPEFKREPRPAKLTPFLDI